MKPDFIARTAKIIAEVMVRTCIDKLDTKVIEEILQDELIKYRNEVFKYSRNIGYDESHNDDLNEAVAIEEATYSKGYSKGYYEGYNKGYDDGHESGLEEAVDCAYNEGYDDGLNEAVAAKEAAYSRGFDDGRAEQE